MAQPWAGRQGQLVPSGPGPSPRSVPAADSREILALSTSAGKVSANYRQLLLPPRFLGKVTQRRQERPKLALRSDLFPAALLHPGSAQPSRWPGPPPPCGHMTTTPGQRPGNSVSHTGGRLTVGVAPARKPTSELEGGGASRAPPAAPLPRTLAGSREEERAIPGSPRHRHLSGACGHRAVTDAAVTVHTIRK